MLRHLTKINNHFNITKFLLSHSYSVWKLLQLQFSFQVTAHGKVSVPKVGGFRRVLRLSPPVILTAAVWLKYCRLNPNQTIKNISGLIYKFNQWNILWFYHVHVLCLLPSMCWSLDFIYNGTYSNLQIPHENKNINIFLKPNLNTDYHDIVDMQNWWITQSHNFNCQTRQRKCVEHV